jgi:hypothetical protein
MKVYEAIIKIQETLQDLENSVDKQYWPDALKKAKTLISNAEYNEAQVVARQALHRAKEKA